MTRFKWDEGEGLPQQIYTLNVCLSVEGSCVTPTNVLQYYRAVHCGISKWSPCSGCQARCPVLCSRHTAVSRRNILLSSRRTRSRDITQNGGLVFCQRCVHVRRLSRCLRREIHRSVFVRHVPLRGFSSSRDPCQEVQPGAGSRERCPRTVCMLPPASQDLS